MAWRVNAAGEAGADRCGTRAPNPTTWRRGKHSTSARSCRSRETTQARGFRNKVGGKARECERAGDSGQARGPAGPRAPGEDTCSPWRLRGAAQDFKLESSVTTKIVCSSLRGEMTRSSAVAGETEKLSITPPSEWSWAHGGRFKPRAWMKSPGPRAPGGKVQAPGESLIRGRREEEGPAETGKR